MGEQKTWDNVSVQQSIMIPNVAQRLIEQFEAATQEGLKLLNEQYPESFPQLPDGIFYIHIVLGWPGIRADVRERGLHEHMAKGSSYFDGVVASSTADFRIGDDPIDSAQIVRLLSPLRQLVSKGWLQWLEWRWRRRYKPEWLRLLKQKTPAKERNTARAGSLSGDDERIH